MPFQEKNPSVDGFVTFRAEITDPGIAGADQARMYLRDNGSAKTQLVIQFPSGSVQVLATEP